MAEWRVVAVRRWEGEERPVVREGHTRTRGSCWARPAYAGRAGALRRAGNQCRNGSGVVLTKSEQCGAIHQSGRSRIKAIKQGIGADNHNEKARVQADRERENKGSRPTWLCA
jgi:hypothetical protein